MIESYYQSEHVWLDQALYMHLWPSLYLLPALDSCIYRYWHGQVEVQIPLQIQGLRRQL